MCGKDLIKGMGSTGLGVSLFASNGHVDPKLADHIDAKGSHQTSGVGGSLWRARISVVIFSYVSRSISCKSVSHNQRKLLYMKGSCLVANNNSTWTRGRAGSRLCITEVHCRNGRRRTLTQLALMFEQLCCCHWADTATLSSNFTSSFVSLLLIPFLKASF